MNVRSLVVMALVILAGMLIYLDWSMLLPILHVFHVL